MSGDERNEHESTIPNLNGLKRLMSPAPDGSVPSRTKGNWPQG